VGGRETKKRHFCKDYWLNFMHVYSTLVPQRKQTAVSINWKLWPGIVVYICNPSTSKAKVRGWRVQGQPGLPDQPSKQAKPRQCNTSTQSQCPSPQCSESGLYFCLSGHSACSCCGEWEGPWLSSQCSLCPSRDKSACHPCSPGPVTPQATALLDSTECEVSSPKGMLPNPAFKGTQ
jgi:hypothetical protein